MTLLPGRYLSHLQEVLLSLSLACCSLLFFPLLVTLCKQFWTC
uniref:Uncharacterized protein n=1 Tax=Anguilla anguilla TaxID=7936 RepID=A0A0E9U935_ANGAN